jgi:hypothetical protein
MPKLNLKRTPAEEEQHQLRKERRAARKAAKSRARRLSVDDADGDDTTIHSRSGSPYHAPHKRRRTQTHDPPLHHHHHSSDDEEQYGPHPSTSYKPDYDAIRARLEEERFREKMYGAHEDDAGVFGVEERLSEFVHVPERWRGLSEGKGMEDPQGMGDEEYAEWVRAGMWK